VLPSLLKDERTSGELAHSRLAQLPHDELAKALQVGASSAVPRSRTDHAPEHPGEAPEDGSLRQPVLSGVLSDHQRYRFDQPLRVQGIVGEKLRRRGA
jgi:hypothetical protein